MPGSRHPSPRTHPPLLQYICTVALRTQMQGKEVKVQGTITRGVLLVRTWT